MNCISKGQLADIKRVAREVDPAAEGDEYLVKVVLLASATIGPQANAISEATGIPAKKIRIWARNWRANGVWYGSLVDCAGWSDEDSNSGITEFLLDCMVGLGLLERVDPVVDAWGAKELERRKDQKAPG